MVRYKIQTVMLDAQKRVTKYHFKDSSKVYFAIDPATNEEVPITDEELALAKTYQIEEQPDGTRTYSEEPVDAALDATDVIDFTDSISLNEVHQFLVGREMEMWADSNIKALRELWQTLVTTAKALVCDVFVPHRGKTFYKFLLVPVEDPSRERFGFNVVLAAGLKDKAHYMSKDPKSDEVVEIAPKAKPKIKKKF